MNIKDKDIINYKLQSLIDRINQRSKLHMSGSEIHGFFAAMVGEIIAISQTVNQKPEAERPKDFPSRWRDEELKTLVNAFPKKPSLPEPWRNAWAGQTPPQAPIWPELTPQDVWGTDKPLEGPL